MTSAFARVRKGERAVDYAPHGHWNTTTLVAGLTLESPIAPMILDGPMDTAAFEAYVRQMLIPAVPRGSIVVMDNLSAHKSPVLARVLQDAGAHPGGAVGRYRRRPLGDYTERHPRLFSSLWRRYN